MCVSPAAAVWHAEHTLFWRQHFSSSKTADSPGQIGMVVPWVIMRVPIERLSANRRDCGAIEPRILPRIAKGSNLIGLELSPRFSETQTFPPIVLTTLCSLVRGVYDELVCARARLYHRFLPARMVQNILLLQPSGAPKRGRTAQRKAECVRLRGHNEDMRRNM